MIFYARLRVWFQKKKIKVYDVFGKLFNEYVATFEN